MFSELAQRSLDAAFTTEFTLDGRFVPVTVKQRRYWYFDAPAAEGGKHRRYVGPADDPAIQSRVDRFKDLKADFQGRRKLVSTLVREAHLPQPDRMTGDVVAALAEAGLFRLRGVLIDTAFQVYPALLGVRVPATAMRTSDTDFAQFHAISAAAADSLPPMLEVIRAVDPTFREVPDVADGRRTTRYVAQSGFQVEFLTPNTGSATHDGKPATMPALGGAAATPLRFLDFLIHQPVRTVLLYRSGIPVTVPAPERYAVHKLIVASRRRKNGDGTAKARKDLAQAAILTEALAMVQQQDDLASAFVEAWDRGPAWREAIARSIRMLEAPVRGILWQAIVEGCRDLGIDPARYDAGAVRHDA